MTEDQIKINEALEVYLESYLSQEAKRKIAGQYGENIAAQVEAIYNASMDVEVDWNTANMNSALPVLHEMLVRDYPWLSEKARMNLNYSYIMCWK